MDVVRKVAAPYPYRAPGGLESDDFVDYLVDDLQRTITRLGADNIACYILEPVLGAGGVIVPLGEGPKNKARPIAEHANRILAGLRIPAPIPGSSG